MSRRTFASWADPTASAKTRPSRLTNPFAGFLRDLAQVGKGWRWGSRPPVPRTLPDSARERIPAVRRRRSIAAMVGTARIIGLDGSASGSRVVLAHVESPADLAVLLAAIPDSWRIVTSRVPQALLGGRSVLYVTDVATPESATVAAEAAAMAVRFGRPLVPVVVRRLRPAPADDTPGPTARGPKPRLVDEVRVRFADPIADGHAASAARTAMGAIGALLAEDDATWWEVLRGQASSSLTEPMAPWRRVWTRTAPARSHGRQRKPIWR